MPNSEESRQRSHKATTQQAPIKAWTGHPYPAYKDSGVEWLGEVPQSWGIFRLKGVVANVTDLTKELDGDNIYLALEHVESWTGKFSIMNNNIDFDSQAKRFQSGDVLFGKLRPYLAKVVCPGRDGVCAGEFLVLRPRHAGLLSKYLEQLLRSKPAISAIDASTFGAKMPRADWQFIGNMKIPLPPLSEQRAISHFLDDANERIQRYIHAKEKLIKLLEEQKRVIIHQAVTGQIDIRTGQPYPAYKDSGVEWMGEVPEHWEVGTVKRGYDIKLGKMLQTKPNDANDIEVPYLKAKDVQWFSVQPISGARMWASPGDIEQFSVSGGDLLVCEGGEGGRCGILADQVSGYIIQNSLHRVRSHYGNSNTFLQYTMRAVADTGWFAALNNKATIAHFTYEKFGALRVPFPSSSEQHAIARFLTDTCQRISAACTAVKREIELLHEYRSRLIADVVTGKLDVREAAALPEKEPPTGGDNCQDGMAFAPQVQSRCP